MHWELNFMFHYHSNTGKTLLTQRHQTRQQQNMSKPGHKWRLYFYLWRLNLCTCDNPYILAVQKIQVLSAVILRCLAINFCACCFHVFEQCQTRKRCVSYTVTNLNQTSPKKCSYFYYNPHFQSKQANQHLENTCLLRVGGWSGMGSFKCTLSGLLPFFSWSS